jgi:hypothetical protein
MSKQDGVHASPYSALAPGGPHMYADSEGMTLRQYYAAKAMQSIALNCMQNEISTKAISLAAFEIADAMIAFEHNEP